MLWRNVRNIILHQRHLLNTFLIFFLLAKFSPEYVLNKVVAAKFRKSCFGAPHINGILLEKFFFSHYCIKFGIYICNIVLEL